MNHRPIDAVFNRSFPLDSSAFLSLGLMLVRLHLEHGFEQLACSSMSGLEHVLVSRNGLL